MPPTDCGGRTQGNRVFPPLLGAHRVPRLKYLEIGQRLHPGWTSQLGEVKAAPSTHLKDTNNSKVSGSIAQALLTRHGSRWQGRDGAGPVPESHKDLQATPYGVSSRPVTCGRGAEGLSCGTPS